MCVSLPLQIFLSMSFRLGTTFELLNRVESRWTGHRTEFCQELQEEGLTGTAGVYCDASHQESEDYISSAHQAVIPLFSLRSWEPDPKLLSRNSGQKNTPLKTLTCQEKTATEWLTIRAPPEADLGVHTATGQRRPSLCQWGLCAAKGAPYLLVSHS